MQERLGTVLGVLVMALIVMFVGCAVPQTPVAMETTSDQIFLTNGAILSRAAFPDGLECVTLTLGFTEFGGSVDCNWP